MELAKNRIFLAAVVVFVVICSFLYLARDIVAPFLIAAFVSHLIYPFIATIQSYGYKRWVGVVILAIVAVVVLAAALIIFIPSLISEFEKFKIGVSDYCEYFSNYVNTTKTKLEVTVPVIKHYDILGIIITKIRDFIFAGAQQIPAYVMNIFSIFSSIVLIMMLILFMLLGGSRNLNAIVSFFPASYTEAVLSIIYEIDSVLRRFIIGQLIETSFVGIMSWISLSIIGVNFALIIGLVNMIPYFGPFLGLVLATIIGVIQFQTFTIVIKIVISYVIIRLLDSNFVQPLAIARNLNLGPVTMAFAVLAGWRIFGLLGGVVAIPVMAIFRTIFMMLVQRYKKNFC
ncbi:MAG: AI-2E family transporter [Endomicrobium sp.]|jgi:predicted PurR-regulated permease PerM|nr:AI-2E family transporter [Endomicrobium sp.]